MRRQLTGWAVVLLTVLGMGVLAWRQSDREEKGADAMADQHPRGEEPLADVEVDGERFVVVPSSVSQGRLARTGLPREGSEDASHLLERPTPAVAEVPFDAPRDYRPDDRVDWVVDVEFDGSPVLQRSEVLGLFDAEWHKAHGRPELYGFSPEDGHWTYLRAGGVPETYTKLAFSWSLFDPLAEGEFDVSTADLGRYQQPLEDRLAQLGQPVLRPNRSPEEAARLARRIAEVVSECDRSVTVVLAAPDGRAFDGRAVWDVMLCLGLRWGDMDVFHWENPSGVGDDDLIGVWTSTPPGYFLPERVAAGEVRVHDLVFGYSIPRSADPEAVFDSLMRAVGYARERLGGDVLDPDGRPLDEQAVGREVRETVRRLKEAGFTPGVDATLRVF